MKIDENKNILNFVQGSRFAFHFLFWITMGLSIGFDLVAVFKKLGVFYYLILLSGYLILPMFMIYFNLYYLMPKIYKRSSILYWILLLLLVSFFSIILIFYNNWVIKDMAGSTQYKIDFINNFISNFFYGTRLLFLSWLLKLSLDWFDQQQKLKELQITSLKSELNYLKAQVNPHFLFNTLNNLFALAQEHHNDDLASGISKLSGLMRYMLYDSNSNMVPLQKEIDYVKDYIGICMLRVDKSDDVSVHFNVTGDTSTKFIAPMVLIPFVENSFKHGISLKEKSFVDIVLDAKTKDIKFSISNSNHSYIDRPADEYSGIGLENVKKRLSLIYEDNYKIDITRSENSFLLNLTLTTTDP